MLILLTTLSVTLTHYDCITVPDIDVNNVCSSAGSQSSITSTVSLRITSTQSPGSTDGRCQTAECSAACISSLRLDMGRYYRDPTDHGISRKSRKSLISNRELYAPTTSVESNVCSSLFHSHQMANNRFRRED